MKLLTFSYNGNESTRLGAYVDTKMVDLMSAHRFLYGSVGPKNWFTSVSDLLRGGDKAFEFASSIVADARRAMGGNSMDEFTFKEEDVSFQPVVTGSPKVLCVTVNYAAHGAAYSTKPPEEPYLFIKFPNILVGHKSPVLLSKSSKKCDSEIELAVVIGKKGKYVSRDKFEEYVAGYTIFNDFSFRDRRVNKSDPTRINWLHLKNLDTAAPIGPWLVTRDEIPDPHNLKMTIQLNDSKEEKEIGSTHDMIHKIPELIEYVSNGLTLEPGDVISTGTPFSVAFGHERFLKGGDSVKAEIEGIGTLVNPMVNES